MSNHFSLCKADAGSVAIGVVFLFRCGILISFRPEDRATLETDPSAETGDMLAGEANASPLFSPARHPESDKLKAGGNGASGLSWLHTSSGVLYSSA